MNTYQLDPTLLPSFLIKIGNPRNIEKLWYLVTDGYHSRISSFPPFDETEYTILIAPRDNVIAELSIQDNIIRIEEMYAHTMRILRGVG